MGWKIGDKSICAGCGREIVFVGPYWDHQGEIKPRHPALPKLPVEPELEPLQPAWMAMLDERTQKHIAFAREYATRYAHGAPGHLDLMTIAFLAGLLDNYAGHGDPYPPRPKVLP